MCMGSGRVCAYGRGRGMHGEREGVYTEGVECACMGRGCVYGRGGVSMDEERKDGVYGRG